MKGSACLPARLAGTPRPRLGAAPRRPSPPWVRMQGAPRCRERRQTSRRAGGTLSADARPSLGHAAWPGAGAGSWQPREPRWRGRQWCPFTGLWSLRPASSRGAPAPAGRRSGPAAAPRPRSGSRPSRAAESRRGVVVPNGPGARRGWARAPGWHFSPGRARAPGGRRPPTWVELVPA